ncbi:formate dehydrogenase accessory sulfurtransferase FdhD [Gluconobacter kondonii]|uniref:formate dehydrogenase accessory sulfurtransferase FdhD n=1 Tax=Gluconobacter kondonii TaxID=941463 RepID=UPI001B8ADFB7|nr:formate dehydrogenase accessory sulfurtransferase FdhD [Gluconobacter kondonii]MBS1066865.1 formate dehydrogenase accessory sulfurtransferase FdhD [Gluconobacter kondonii]
MTPLFQSQTATLLSRPEEEIVLNIADEVPVRLVFNGIVPHGVMMMTPNHLTDFAYGYCLTEQIITDKDQIRSVSVLDGEDGLTLDVTISGDCLSTLLRRRPRAHTGHSSCGLCGTDTVLSVDAHEELPFPINTKIAPTAILRALHDLEKWQTLNATTRMVHGAAWADQNGKILLIREDIGRHNALDKLIGAWMCDDRLFGNGFCLLTSRYSYEMALKTVRAGMAMVVAVSAPTDRAFRLAQKMNQTLIAIARQDRQFVFCGEARLIRTQDS